MYHDVKNKANMKLIHKHFISENATQQLLTEKKKKKNLNTLAGKIKAF